MEFIQSLRQYIGHAPVLVVGAAVLIVDEENRLLLMKCSDSGCWGPPGGNVTIVYLSRDLSGDIHLNGEHTEWSWFAAADIPDNLSPPIEPVIQQFVKAYKLFIKS